MECPKCHRQISDKATACPYCHKVLALVCPNCRTLNHNTVCTNCGYIILEKCAKCGKITPTSHKKCKCGFSTALSIAYNECEIDEFADVIIRFNALPKIRSILKSQDLYTKFLTKLKNLLTAMFKGIDAHVIIYGDTYNINFNKELSFATSVNKAVRFALKTVTAFSGLNQKLIEQLGTPLRLSITILKKRAEELLINKTVSSNVKLMVLKNRTKKYLQGTQVIMDQYCEDSTNEYKTDSLYSLEMDGKSVMFYEILLENYIIPPGEDTDTPIDISPVKTDNKKENELFKKDLYAFNAFDINAKCKFEKCAAENLKSALDINQKIIAIKCYKDIRVNSSDIIKYYQNLGLKPVYISCTEEMNYKPWGFFEKLFKAVYNLPVVNKLSEDSNNTENFKFFSEFIKGNIPKASSSEDARFAFFEQFIGFVSSLKNYVIIADGFEYLDDTSIQALELYFDKFKKILTNFVFIIDNKSSVHSKIKGLLQTPLYKEITLLPSSMEDILSSIKEDAADFIDSFYFEKIRENYGGSKLYFENAIKYLKDKDVLISFENKLLIKTKRSVLLPIDLPSLIRTRLKGYGKQQEASLILAYSVFLGERLDFATLKLLGINNLEQNAAFLDSTGFTCTLNGTIYVNNYTFVRPVIQASLKPEVQTFLVKTIMAKAGKLLDNTSLLIFMGALSMFKEESMLLWKNSQISISVGDYDAYLKNCLGYLDIIEKSGENLSQESIENNKKEIFQNILMYLYSYSPAKIYSIENILLSDAIKANDDKQIVKLSNLMLQGALITSNYTEASVLLHNILTRMENPALIVNGAINTRFLLLSLVNIEILFNTGDYRDCIELSGELLEVIKPEILENIKPANFSINLFVNHLLDTFRLAAFAKLLAGDNDIEEFCNLIYSALNVELPDKNCIFAIKDFLAGKTFAPDGIENATPFSKIIYLILNEISGLKEDYKQFAQNIYQAKLLAADLYQTQLEFICDILIGYAYGQIGLTAKADMILNDVLKTAEKSAIFNIIIIARYVLAKIKFKTGETNDAFLLINNALADIQHKNNQAKIFYAMFERLFIDAARVAELDSFNIEAETQKLLELSPNGELERIVRCNASENKDFVSENSSQKENSPETSDKFSDTLDTETH